MIRFIMQFKISPSLKTDFYNVYEAVYLPAISPQKGYLGSALMTPYAWPMQNEPASNDERYDIAISIDFDTEEHRQDWVRSTEHETAWTAVRKISTHVTHCGYEITKSQYKN